MFSSEQKQKTFFLVAHTLYTLSFSVILFTFSNFNYLFYTDFLFYKMHSGMLFRQSLSGRAQPINSETIHNRQYEP